jgi:VanZ family protein
MGVIFVGSTELFAEQPVSRVIGPLLRWLIPGVSDEVVQQVRFLVRKSCHFGEYAVLAALVRRALAAGRLLDRPQLWWRVAGISLAVCVLYAVSDEAHQAFVPSRQASALDVLVDAIGAALGLAVVWCFHERRRSCAQAVSAKPCSGG